jgi:hypothetical protein
MLRSTLKLVFALALLVGVWSMPIPSEARPLYFSCESYCCGGGGTWSSPCKDAFGVVTTCGDWGQTTACP